jgi:hypothetical protein
MKLFTIHRNDYGLSPEPDIRVVKEGFNGFACIFSFLWALIGGYWMLAIGLLVVSVIISGVFGVLGLDLFGQAVVNIAFALLVGYQANDLVRWTLKRRGFKECDVVSAANAEHALERYLATAKYD